MTRSTRSQHNKIMEDETAHSINSPELGSVQSDPSALTEIDANLEEVSTQLEQLDILGEAPNATKTNRNRRGRKGKGRKQAAVEVDAAAPEPLRALQKEIRDACDVIMGSTEDIVEIDPQITALATPKVSQTKKATKATVQTPRFDPAIHEPHIDICQKGAEDESLLEIIMKRSPSKTLPSADFSQSMESEANTRAEGTAANTVAEAESQSPEPAKALEPENIENEPEKSQDEPMKATEETPIAKCTDVEVKSSTTVKISTKPATIKARSKEPRSTVSKAAPAPAPRAVSKPAKETTHTRTSPAVFSTSSKPRSAEIALESKRLSVQKRIVVQKSDSAGLTTARATRPMTRPNFELPGEAIARQLKERKEERLRLADEEAKKKQQIHAKIGSKPKASTVVVRGTAASRARESLMSRFPTADSASASKARSVSAMVKSSEPKDIVSRKSTINRSEAPRALAGTFKSSPKTSPRVSITVQVPALSKAPINSTDMAQQRAKAKARMAAAAKEKDDLEKTRLEKEASAKRARAEAAERGREASRAWAEKQKLKTKVMSPAVPAH